MELQSLDMDGCQKLGRIDWSFSGSKGGMWLFKGSFMGACWGILRWTRPFMGSLNGPNTQS